MGVQSLFLRNVYFQKILLVKIVGELLDGTNEDVKKNLKKKSKIGVYFTKRVHFFKKEKCLFY
jgi:hypothetical protein